MIGALVVVVVGFGVVFLVADPGWLLGAKVEGLIVGAGGLYTGLALVPDGLNVGGSVGGLVGGRYGTRCAGFPLTL